MIVRDLEDDVRDRLRERAKSHGRSMEAEVREILRTAVMSDRRSGDPEPGLGTRIASLFADEGLDDEFAESRAGWHGKAARPATFDE